MMRLQDPEQTKIILVTLAETTPVLEATELQNDLVRAGITPWAWIINTSIAAAHPVAPLLHRRAQSELTEIAGIRQSQQCPVAIVPLLAREPIGIPALRSLMDAMPLSRSVSS
jgi:arsenite-transporting ATPase